MVNFWDTSAVVPLLVRESDSRTREGQLENAEGMVVWWATRLECVSAICRRQREGQLSAEAIRTAMARLGALEKQWMLIPASPAVLARAERLLRVHSLRAADSLQLAAALLATFEEPERSQFHTADSRLALAAGKEGFSVV